MESKSNNNSNEISAGVVSTSWSGGGRYVALRYDELRAFAVVEALDGSVTDIVTEIVTSAAVEIGLGSGLGWPIEWCTRINRELLAQASKERITGASFLACVVSAEALAFVQCGSGTAWRIRHNSAEIMSYDHSIAMQRLRTSGDIGEYRDLVKNGFGDTPARALGMTDTLSLDIHIESRRVGDVLLIASAPEESLRRATSVLRAGYRDTALPEATELVRSGGGAYVIVEY
jgi:hypothetical protein